MYRFRPTEYEMKAYPIDQYPAKCRKAAAVMLMIMNNLDPRVAQFPHELITYGGNGAVLQNWAQYHLVMQYLATMSEDQTLVMYSGHPLGLFPSSRVAPRVVITNGMMVPNYSSRELYERFHALGVTMYGQMTAGSYCYIGPQGIVHGTTITVLGAARKYLGTSDLRGRVFVSSGLGGMSGAQAKAAVLCGAIGVVAEVNEAALEKRLRQGWVQRRCDDLEELVRLVREARRERPAGGLSIGFYGNVVDVWERFAREPEHLVDLGSDQTSLHNPFGGGYYPVGVSFEEANRMIAQEPERFRELVRASLRRQVAAINTLAERGGFYFWDYGNSFLLEAARAGAPVHAERPTQERPFRYPSYVEDIMGDVFSLGFGPFRWVCTSGDPADLALTDQVAAQELEVLASAAPELAQQQYQDNLRWIREAGHAQLVVGSQARILYSDLTGRRRLAHAFNRLVREGRLRGPVVCSRDHHDVSGTDSPFRETANVRDGSRFTADMAVQNVIGDAFRGATWVALHNGGGTGWGQAINGGFGLVLDGSDEADRAAEDMLFWDVANGVARRAWAGHPYARETALQAMREEPRLRLTLASTADDSLLDAALAAHPPPPPPTATAATPSSRPLWENS
jgi:urocanate hydratase